MHTLYKNTRKPGFSLFVRSRIFDTVCDVCLPVSSIHLSSTENVLDKSFLRSRLPSLCILHHRALFHIRYRQNFHKRMQLLSGIVAALGVQGALAFTLTNNRAGSALTRRYGTLDGKTIDGDFTPVNNMVLIKLDAKESETSGGLLLASKVKVKKNEGTIVSTGPGKINQESGVKFDMPVSPGEKAIYGQYSGTQLNLNGDAHVLIQDADILVKYTGDKLNLATAQMLRDNVLVKIEKKEDESTGGILLAKSSTGKAKPTIGEVIKVGPGRYATNGKLMEMDVKEGDMIRFRDFTGNTVEIDGEDYSVVRMNDILAKF